MICQQLATKLSRSGLTNPSSQGQSRTLQGADGNELNQGKPLQIALSISNELFLWTFIPVENLQTPLLLGMDFMNKEEVVIDLSTTPSSVSFSKRNTSIPFQQVFRTLHKYAHTKSILYVKGEPAVVPPHEVTKIRVEHAHNDPFALATRNGLVLTRTHTRVHTPLRVVPGIVNFEQGAADISVFNVSSSPFFLDGFSAVAEVVPTDPTTPLRADSTQNTVNLVWNPHSTACLEDTGNDEIDFDFGMDIQNFENSVHVTPSFAATPVAEPTEDDLPDLMMSEDEESSDFNDSDDDLVDFRSRRENYKIPGRFLL